MKLAIPNSKPRRPTQNRRFKTFTGCWTCRARRVKCDETRPACKRCTNSSRSCEGYSVRLSWDRVDRHTQSSESLPVSKLSRTALTPSSIPVGDVNAFLSECENATGTVETRSFGPFSVFSLTDSGKAQFPPWIQAETSVNAAGESHSETNGEAETPPATLEMITASMSEGRGLQNSAGALPRYVITSPTGSSDPNLSSDPSLLGVDAAFGSPNQGSETDYNNYNIASQPSLEQAGHSAHDTSLDVTGTRSEFAAVDPYLSDPNRPPSFHQLPQWLEADAYSYSRFNELPNISCQVKLLHHWAFFLCKNMVPVDTVQNPYRLIYLPYACEGMNPLPGTSSSKIALFHGLCAVAAESMLYLGHASEEVTEVLAARHTRVALQQLQSSINCLRPDTLDSTLAAILICIMRDTIGGHPQSWRGHVQGALKCLEEPAKLRVQPRSNLHVVLGQFLCIAVLGNVETALDMQALISQLPEEKSHLTGHHGITKFTLESILWINRLATCYDTVDPAIVDRLELHLYLHTPSVNISDMDDGPISIMLAQHYALVYYYASLIHLQRVLRQRPASELQGILSVALSHLETVEQTANNANGCILLWPCLVIATECQELSLQERALAWFKTKKRHGFGNVDAGSRICERYWAWREDNAEKALSVSWQEFVRTTELDVVPL